MRVFITGMVGTLGTELALLCHSRGHEVFGCSRDEERCRVWSCRYGGAPYPYLFVADAFGLADRSSEIGRLLPSFDAVYHLAAMKHVDLCESNPTEAFRQNVLLTNAVASACAAARVPFCFASSDKACLPQSVYGATKLLAERVTVLAGGTAVRLGNLIGSSGSVFQVWKEQVERGERIQLTDPEMTRYFMPIKEAAEFLFDHRDAGGVIVPNPLLSIRMGDVATVIGDVDVVGPRPGETQHQWLIAPGSRVLAEANFIRVLSATTTTATLTNGMCSSSAVRWYPRALLREVGI